MEISDVRIKMIGDSNSRLRAFCTITFDGDFVVRDLKIVDGVNGLFVAMPSRKIMASCGKCRHKNQIGSSFCNECGGRLRREEPSADNDGRTRLHRDIAHPINTPFREKMQSQVIEAFHAECERADEPGYEPPDETVDADVELDHGDDVDERIGDADGYTDDAEDHAGDVDDHDDHDDDVEDVEDVEDRAGDVDDHDDDVEDHAGDVDDHDDKTDDDIDFAAGIEDDTDDGDDQKDVADDHSGLDEYGSLIADLDRGEGAPDRGGSPERRGRPEPSRTDGDGRDRSRGGGSRGGRGRRGRGQRGHRQTEQPTDTDEKGRARPPKEATPETKVASTDTPAGKRSDSSGETKRVEPPRDRKTADAPAPSQRSGRSRGRGPRTAPPSDPPQRDRVALPEVAEEPPPVEDNADESGEFGCGIL
ncbi:MAG: septation protein SpoVG family protein [Planctomycetes bacterium]|nr:septation protein SpoVG family protein [Planctomycetota bacterium]